MEDKESGSLSRKPALDLLVELHRGQVTGSLKLERAPLQKAVYFRDGQILFAASNDPKDQLASILVEEGKLGPDQMQVAQARVSPGNPLAKVLTELGYISQRELADAARIKVEKILTDLYTWKEGTYQFATKSLPKGAIDLELSTSRLLFASIRRVQDRDWILNQLGSLETVLTPTADLDGFIESSHAEPLAADVLRLADGVKTVKQIGSVSSLGEFEVCKILTAALVAGSLTRDGAETSSSDEAFAFAGGDPFSAPSEPPSFGVETVGLPTQSPSSPDSMSYDTIFQAAAPAPSPPPEENDRTVFDAPPLRSTSSSDSFRPAPPPPPERPRHRSSTELVIDEPEPDVGDEPLGRMPPRPRKRGGSASGGMGGIVKAVAAVALVALAGFSVYYFIWPMFSGGSSSQTSPASPTTTTSSVVSQTAGGPTTGTDPRAATSTSAPATATTAATTTAASIPSPAPGGTSPPVSAPVTPAPVPPRPAPAPTTSAPPVAPAPGGPRPAPPSGAARPPSGSPTTPSGDGGHALLRSGNLSGAARAFQQELLRDGANKFTIALGLYCNEENVGRMVESAGGSREIYVLPTLVDGRSCYRVVWGLFDSREAAERGMGTVPSGVRAGDAAPVAISRFLR